MCSVQTDGEDRYALTSSSDCWVITFDAVVPGSWADPYHREHENNNGNKNRTNNSKSNSKSESEVVKVVHLKTPKPRKSRSSEVPTMAPYV